MMKISRVFFRLEKGMLSLQQRHRFSVHLAAAASGAVIFLFLVVVPVTRQNALLNGRIAGQRRLLFRYEQLLQKREMIRREYRAIFESFAQKTQTDPSVSVLKALEELAGQAGVKILNIRQTRVAAHDKFREVLVSLTAE
ncbi:MAG: hypothetical protein MJA29_12130, partial [Candidatus Omnitrophica bacterium]|nr:hypothetical protein [Candidatus Omnitrophota bacterium]